jgi:sugar phosphate permease
MLPGMPSGQKGTFLVTWLAYAGFYLCRKNFSVVIPLLVGMHGLSKADLANAVAVYSFAYAAGQFTMGSLADQFGSRAVVSAGLFVSVAATLAMGFWHTALVLCVLQGVNGLAQASGWPGLVKIMGAWFSRQQRGVVMAWWSTNYALGGLLATAFATWVVTHPSLLAEWQWRRGFWLPALLLLPIALLFLAAAREKPASAGVVAGGSFSFSQLGQVLSSPRIQTIAAVYFVLKLTRYSFLFWLPLYMTEQLNYSPEEAGYSSAVFELAGFFGVLAAGYLSDRWMRSRRFPAAALLLGVLAVGCLLHPALAESSRLGNLLGIALIGAGIFGPDTLLSGAAVQDAAPSAALATTAGVVNGLGSAGQILSPWIVVFVANHYGWNSLLYGFAGLALLCSLLMVASRFEKAPVFAHEAAS